MKSAAAAGVLFCSVLILCWHGVAQSPPSKIVPTLDQPRVNTLDGAVLFSAYCAVCHGASAKGDGPMAKMLIARTPDLTRIAERRGGKFPRAQIEAIISGENEVSRGHGTRQMPVWGPAFSQVDRDMDLGRVRTDNLARYLETLQVK